MKLHDLRSTAYQYRRTLQRSASTAGGLRPTGAVRRPDPRWLFVVGSPRSGTTFTAESLGAVPGILDLGEVPRFKAVIPEVYAEAAAGRPQRAEQQVHKVLSRAARVGMGGGSRCLEQTPESSFIIPQIAAALPQASFVHLIRDGRDVAASLIDRGWLAPGRPRHVVDAEGTTTDDAGQPFGQYARFWVEPDLRAEFEAADEARRCAWAWRRYESAARAALAALPAERVIHIRYEELVSQPGEVARHLAEHLGHAELSDHFASAFAAAHPRSIGRYRSALGHEQIATIEEEAGDLLRDLGYR